MTMLRPLLHALTALLLISPLHAQNIRITGTLAPLQAAPLAGLGSQLAITPSALSAISPLSAPSLVPALSPAALTPTPSLEPVSLAALEVVISAASRPDFSNSKRRDAAAKSPALPATPADGWASRFNFRLSGAAAGAANVESAGTLFDGIRELKDDTGAVFTAVPKGDGTVRVHIVEQGPLAATKAVPGTEGLKGQALLDALSGFAAQGHQGKTYKETSGYMFSTADQVVINGVKGVVDAYSGIFVPGTSKSGGDYPEPGDANGDGFPDKAGMNVEHTWPQSLFQQALPQRSDIHHLMATFMHPNSVRGSLPFGVVTGTPDYENKAGAKRGNGVFEPPDAVKGRVARGLLYFYARHKDSRMFGRTSVVFWNQQIDILMKWNRDFPPSAFEARHNDLAQAWQGNRNPFIDDYLLADRIGADAFRAGNPARGPGEAALRLTGRPLSRR
jgi:deoxyribonuclease-1